MLGTKALQIFDETTWVVRCVLRLDRVLQARVVRQVHAVPRGHLVAGAGPGRLEQGEGHEGDIELLLDQCDNILGRSFCALGDGATSPITRLIQYFRDEYLAHLTHGGCPFDPAASTLFATAGALRMTTHRSRRDASRPTWSP